MQHKQTPSIEITFPENPALIESSTRLSFIFKINIKFKIDERNPQVITSKNKVDKIGTRRNKTCALARMPPSRPFCFFFSFSLTNFDGLNPFLVKIYIKEIRVSNEADM